MPVGGIVVENATILVPGFNDDTRILRTLSAYLDREGLNPYPLSPQPSNGTVPLEDLATQLAEQIEQIAPGAQRLNLVGFSMGGLICRVYLQRLGGVARTDRVVTVATPHQGTWTAYSYYNRPACMQMRPGSRLLTELNRDLSSLRRLAFTSIWTPFDLTIMPALNSYLAVGNFVAVLSPFHQTMLRDERVLRVIAATLRHPVANRTLPQQQAV